MGRILVVDDDAAARARVVELALKAGDDAVGVRSGPDAVARLAEGGFDLVISEVVSATMEGVALARTAAGLAPAVPVLLISGVRRPVLPELGVVGFLPKPVDADRLGRFLSVLYRRPVAPGGGRESSQQSWSGLDFLGEVAGPIERFSPLRVLFLAHRVGASGALVIERPGLSARIGLRAGRIVSATGVPALYADLSPAVPDGSDLVRDLAVAVASGHLADRALRGAAERLGMFLVELAEARGGRVEFDPSWTPAAGTVPLPEGAPRVIALGLARSRADAHIARTWDALTSAWLRRRLPDDAAEDRWGLDVASSRVLRLVGRGRTLDSLLQEGAGGDERRRAELLRGVDALHLLGFLTHDVGAQVASPAPGADRGAAAGTGLEDERVVRLTKTLASLKAAHPVEILELETRLRIGEEEVANAYRDISKRYHPDTFFSAPPAVRLLAEACFTRVNAANEAMRAPGGFAEAKRFVEARAKGVAFVTELDHVAARVAFRRADALVRGRDWKGADAMLQEAVRLDANTWPHALQAAWVGWLSRRLPPVHAIAALNRLSPPEPARQAEVQVVVGNILKQEGNVPEALARYRAALRLHPENREAQRELRLHEQRAAAAAPPAPTGLVGMLTRKKG